MEKAIKKAILGGWPKAYVNGGDKTTGKLDSSDLLDPTFWQALGKSMVWEKHIITFNVPAKEVTVVRKSGVISFHVKAHRRTLIRTRKNQWRKNWHKFIDQVADGKDINLFFKELLK